MYTIGYDIGSSSVKAALVHLETGALHALGSEPATEMDILSPQPGWAEQHPELWWTHLCTLTRRLLAESGVAPEAVTRIGIAYQMHGLVTVDEQGQPLRPAIIWCDSRAVDSGHAAFQSLGEPFCLEHLLNSPGNFTAAKLKWVKDHEPEIYRRIWKVMLPGDYIAFKMTGEALTTVSGLSEGVFWDFKAHAVSDVLCQAMGIDPGLIPPLALTFGEQGTLHAAAAAEMGLRAGARVCYRAGDQPNNALSLNVLQPGEVAATGGTSGVVYAVSDALVHDPLQRVNSFAHVNHTRENPRIGILLCINGAGIQYSWMRKMMASEGISYPEMEQLAAGIPIGSEGLCTAPFGNGAERMLGNRNPGAQILGIDFNRHGKAHFYRAALEGVAFAFVYGMNMLRDLGVDISRLRVGNDNLFQSAVFSETIAGLTNCHIEVKRSTGALGAALAAGNVSADHIPTLQTIAPPAHNQGAYIDAYAHWLACLNY